MLLGYDYGNTRLRARRSRLLMAADYDGLLAKTNIDEVITTLTEGPYKEDIERALVRFTGVRCVFEAIRLSLTRTLNRVREFYRGEPRFLVELLLRRWDRHNLLAILRGQSREVPSDRVLAAIVPAGQLDQVALRELARQPGLRAAIDLLATWQLPYAKTLRQVEPRTGTMPDLDQLELALNRFHYASLSSVLAQGGHDCGLMLEHLGWEVDLLNLRTILRVARRPGIIPLIQQRYNAADIRPLLIEPRGRLSTRWLAQLVAETGELEAVVHALSDTAYGPALEIGWQRYQAAQGDFTLLERELERWQAEQTAAMFNRDPLSIAIPIAYMGSIETEAANLRLIAQAVDLGMNRQQVRQDLIIVSHGG
ncbi:MAG TPA: V-type ATPase subunit [Anaerolineae bacterium]